MTLIVATKAAAKIEKIIQSSNAGLKQLIILCSLSLLEFLNNREPFAIQFPGMISTDDVQSPPHLHKYEKQFLLFFGVFLFLLLSYMIR